MNPLDREELQPFLRNLEKEMPIHTDNTVKIKRSYSQGLPKNLSGYSAFVDNHFLNDNLAIIEEMNHRDSKHPIPRWFREYQIKYFAKHGILNKDPFFTSRMRDGYRKHFSADLTEIREIGSLPYSGSILGFGSIVDTKVFGSQLEAGVGGSDAGDTNPQNVIYVSTTDSNGIAGQFYDRIAISVGTAAGNIRMAAYDDSSTSPANLLSETSSAAVLSGYQFVSMTEFALATAVVWVAHQVDNSGFRRHRTGGGVYTIGTGKSKAFTYGAYPNPAGSGYSDNSGYKYTMKITHS